LLLITGVDDQLLAIRNDWLRHPRWVMTNNILIKGITGDHDPAADILGVIPLNPELQNLDKSTSLQSILLVIFLVLHAYILMGQVATIVTEHVTPPATL
jgi:hypothetical protein